MAGFLVNELLGSIQLGKMEQNLFHTLEKQFSGTEHLCAVVRSCLASVSSESAIVESGLSSPIKTAST